MQLLAVVDSGMVSVTTTSSSVEPWMRSIAGPEKTACVQYAKTFFAPRSFSTSAAFTSVPAVSIMSSMITQLRPSISPMTCITSETLAFGRRLSMIARSQSELLGQRAGAHHAADVGRDDDRSS